MELADDHELHYFSRPEFNCIATDEDAVSEFVYMFGGEEFDFDWDVECVESDKYDEAYVAGTSYSNTPLESEYELLKINSASVRDYFINGKDINYEECGGYVYKDDQVLKANTGYKFYNVKIVVNDE